MNTHIRIIPIIAALALLVTGCAQAQPADKYEFRRTGKNGNSWTSPTAATLPDSVLTLDGAGAPVFRPRGDFLTAESIDTALAPLSASIAAKENAGVAAALAASHTAAANPHPQYALSTDARLHTHANKTALDKITENAGLPLWNGKAWPGGGGSGGAATFPITGNGVDITAPRPDHMEIYAPEWLQSISRNIIIEGSYSLYLFTEGELSLISYSRPLRLYTNGPATLKDYDTGEPQRIKAADAIDPDDLVTKRQLDMMLEKFRGMIPGM